LKFGLQTSAFLTSKRGVQLAFEQKFSPSLSVLGEAAYLEKLSPNVTIPDAYGIFIIESRWYHVINKKIKNGTSGNNFNSNYFTFGIGKIISREDNPYLLTTMGWGIQRRLTNIGYIDVSLRMNVTMKSNEIGFDETINFEIGFGKSFKKKKA